MDNQAVVQLPNHVRVMLVKTFGDSPPILGVGQG
jgi:hypothetical protein